jgi:hypothetical protein
MALAGVRVCVTRLRMSTVGITTMLRPRVAKRYRRGSSHPGDTSKCASKNTMIGLVTMLAATNRDLRGVRSVKSGI